MHGFLEALQDSIAPRGHDVNITGMDAGGGVTIKAVAWVHGNVARRGQVQSRLLVETRRSTQAGQFTLA